MAEQAPTLSADLVSLQQLIGNHIQTARVLSDQLAQLRSENRDLANQLASISSGLPLPQKVPLQCTEGHPLILSPKHKDEESHESYEISRSLQSIGTPPCIPGSVHEANEFSESSQAPANTRSLQSVEGRSVEDDLVNGSFRYSGLRGILQRAGTHPCTPLKDEEVHGSLRRSGCRRDFRRAGTQPCVSFSSPQLKQPQALLLHSQAGSSLSVSDLPSNTTRATKQSGWESSPSQPSKATPSSARAAWPVFADTQALKERIKEVLTEKQYDITEHYHSRGLIQKVARAPWFERLSGVMVVLSSIWLAVEIDNDHSAIITQAQPIFQVFAHFFCLFFVSELVVRFGAFRDKWLALQHATLLFDLGLVSLLVFETWVMTAALTISGSQSATSGRRMVLVCRTLRLLRTLRLARCIREFPELLVIVRGIAIAFRAMSIILSLLMLIIYFGAIAFTVLLEGTDLGEQRFSSVSVSMGTLLLDGTLSGSRGTQVIREANEEHCLYAGLFLLFVLLANVTVMGVLAGLLVQTVKTVSEVEKEESAVRNITDKMEEVWEQVVLHDGNGDGVIDKKELPCLLGDEMLAKSLHGVGIDLEGLVDISTLYLQQNPHLTKPQFKRMALELRSKEVAKVKDHVETRKFVHTHFQDFSAWATTQRVPSCSMVSF